MPIHAKFDKSNFTIGALAMVTGVGLDWIATGSDPKNSEQRQCLSTEAVQEAAVLIWRVAKALPALEQLV